MVPGARWASVSLLIMIAIMLIGYYVWVYSVIRLHSRLWYNWWQRECIVTYIPPNTAHIYCHTIETINPSNTPVTPRSTEEHEDHDFEIINIEQSSNSIVVEVEEEPF